MQHVLVLDASNDLLEIFRIIFKNDKFKISTCNSLAGLAAHLDSLVPDLIILDIMHSEIKQEMIVENLRRRDGLGNIPIIITSTKAGHIHNCRHIGADGGLEKPFDREKLVSMVRSFLGAAASKKPVQ